MGDFVYISGPFSQSGPSILALRSDTAAIQPWSGPANAWGALAAGDGMLIVGRAGSTTTSIVAAYDPLGTTPRWERTIAASQINELLLAGDTVYGAAATYTFANGQYEYSGRVFALNRADGAVRWQRSVDGTPVALVLHDDTLYLGGELQRVGETAVGNLSALNAASGEPLPWPAELRPNDEVYDLAVDEGRLHLSGTFTAVGLSARTGLAAIDLPAGPTLAAWTPQLPAGALFAGALAVTNVALYVGASFSAGATNGVYGMLIYPLGPPAPIATPTSTPMATATHTAIATATAPPTSTPTATATHTAVPAGPINYRAYLPLLR